MIDLTTGAVRSSYSLSYDFQGGAPHPYPEAPGLDAQFPAYGALASVDPDNNSTRVQSWNVIVERQIGEAWQVSASYLGSYTDRIWVQAQRNPGVAEEPER